MDPAGKVAHNKKNSLLAFQTAADGANKSPMGRKKRKQVDDSRLPLGR
jgi:hypothetical protein